MGTHNFGIMNWDSVCHLQIKAEQFKHIGKDKEFKTDAEAFKAFASTPLGLILVITIDQFLHIACLLPVATVMLMI
jgi:hypothetical protein